MPAGGAAGQQLGGAEQAGDVHVVTAGVRHRHLVAVGVGSRDRAGIGQAGRLPYGQGIHVRPQQHRRALSVAQHSHHARSADAGVDLIAALPEPVADLRGGLPLLVRQLRVLMQIPVESLLSRTHLLDTG
jgi:hypothetical protein